MCTAQVRVFVKELYVANRSIYCSLWGNTSRSECGKHPSDVIYIYLVLFSALFALLVLLKSKSNRKLECFHARKPLSRFKGKKDVRMCATDLQQQLSKDV